jgi:hypothetical protein
MKLVRTTALTDARSGALDQWCQVDERNSQRLPTGSCRMWAPTVGQRGARLSERQPPVRFPVKTFIPFKVADPRLRLRFPP